MCVESRTLRCRTPTPLRTAQRRARTRRTTTPKCSVRIQWRGRGGGGGRQVSAVNSPPCNRASYLAAVWQNGTTWRRRFPRPTEDNADAPAVPRQVYTSADRKIQEVPRPTAAGTAARRRTTAPSRARHCDRGLCCGALQPAEARARRRAADCDASNAGCILPLGEARPTRAPGSDCGAPRRFTRERQTVVTLGARHAPAALHAQRQRSYQ